MSALQTFPNKLPNQQPLGTVGDPVVVSIGGGSGATISTNESVELALINAFRNLRLAVDPRSLRSYRAGHFMIVREVDGVTLTFSGMDSTPLLAAQLIGIWGGAVDGQNVLEVITGSTGNPNLVWTPGTNGGTLVRSSGTWPAVIFGAVWALALRGHDISLNADLVSEIDKPYRDIISLHEGNIDVVHSMIHQGKYYGVNDSDSSVDIVAPKYWRITSPNSPIRCHFIFELDIGGSGGLVEFFEAPTVSTNGTALTAFNSDRNSANTATLVAAFDPTSGGDGTRIRHGMVGTSGGPIRVGGSIGSRSEILLKANTHYFIKFTPTANATPCWLSAEWYEV